MRQCKRHFLNHMVNVCIACCMLRFIRLVPRSPLSKLPPSKGKSIVSNTYLRKLFHSYGGQEASALKRQQDTEPQTCNMRGLCIRESMYMTLSVLEAASHYCAFLFALHCPISIRKRQCIHPGVRIINILNVSNLRSHGFK